MTDVALVELDAAALAAWRPRGLARSEAQYLAAGERPSEARRLADERVARAFQGAEPAEGYHVFAVVADGARVGTVWLAPPEDGSDDRVLLDLEIDEPVRRRGHGRAAILAVESWARADGGRQLSVPVFGDDTAAFALAASLGYAVVATRMHKDVEP